MPPFQDVPRSSCIKAMKFDNHPERAGIIAEMHLRRMPAVTSPARIFQTLRLFDPSSTRPEKSPIGSPPFGTFAAHSSERHGEARDGRGTILLWERHSEAITATAILPGLGDDPLGMSDDDRLMIEWLVGPPATVLRATRILVLQDEADCTDLLKSLIVDPDNLLSAYVSDGIRIWTDFQVRADGFGWLVVATNGQAPADVGRAIQRMQELGNYRNLALLGLTTVRSGATELRRLEHELASISEGLDDAGQIDILLDRLIVLGERISAMEARVTYRLSATRAYTAIVMQRLESLRCRAIPGFQSLDDFTERRLLPAAATCQSFTDRLIRLGQQSAQAMAQLRTKVELRIQHQNQSILQSMKRSAERQLKLQELVEGLSVLAISYYAVSLLAYLVKGLKSAEPALNADVLLAIVSMPVVLLVWIMLRKTLGRKRGSADNGED